MDLPIGLASDSLVRREFAREIFHRAGFPEDASINIHATNEQIETVIGDPRVRGVSLTGSEQADSAVAEIAGRNLKKVVLELGGSDPFILLSTDDLDATVESAVGARLENSGQACNAAKHFVDVLYEPFFEKFTAALSAVKPGDPGSPEPPSAPSRPRTQGAKLVTGGERDGNYFSTTVLTHIDRDSDAYHEEFFGPVARVYRVADEHAAVELANTPRSGSARTSRPPTGSRRCAWPTGSTPAWCLSTRLVPKRRAALRRMKRSGFGRELGRFGTDEFVNKKLIRVGG